MTGYHLSIGYQAHADDTDAWATLKSIVAKLCASPASITAEARILGMPVAVARELAAAYSTFDGTKTEDASLEVIEPQGEEKGEVMQLASGGGDERLHKEAIRRAFCRLVIKDMHVRGFEVNLIVA